MITLSIYYRDEYLEQMLIYNLIIFLCFVQDGYHSLFITMSITITISIVLQLTIDTF